MDQNSKPSDGDDAEIAKWDRYYRDLPHVEEDAVLREFHDELVDLVRTLLPDGGSVLEAGSGGGWQSLALARAGFQVTLLDNSVEALKYAERNFARHGQTARFQAADVFEPDPAEFDLVFNLGAVEHYDVADQARFLRGMAARSRRYVLVVVPNRQCYWYWLWRMWRMETDQWPFGREMPRWSLGDVFLRAGVQLCGHRWLGSAWTAGLISELPGLEPELRESILRIHRSSVVPPEQRCYLTAALGSVAGGAEAVAGTWYDAPSSPAEADVSALVAELADALVSNAARPEASTADPASGGAGEVGFEQGQQVAESHGLNFEYLKNKLTAMTDELLGERERNIELLQTNLQLRTRKNEAERETITLAAQVQNLERTHANLRASVRDLHDLQTVQREKNEELVQLLGELRRENAAAGDEKSRLAADLETARAAQSELRETLQAVNEELEAQRQSQAELLRTTVELREQKAATDAERSALLSEIERLRGSEKELRDALRLIHSSKLWRFASVYWELRRAPRRLRERVGRWSGALRWGRGGRAADRQRSAMRAPAPSVGTGYDVLMLPIIDWEFRFQRPQQIATQLADHGHRVYYLRTTFGNSGRAIEWSEIRDSVYNLKLDGPRDLRIYTDTIPDDVLRGWMEAFASFFERSATEQTVIVVQLPFWWPLADAMRQRWGCRIVYDCMDEHGGFSTNTESMLATEDELVREADLVLAASRPLYEKVMPVAKRALLLRNAADFDHFHQAAREARPRRGDRPVIGYYGAISDWFDVDMVAAAARARPDWRFVLIGSTYGAETAELEELANVELLGERPYGELPDHLRRFDVALLPFKRTALTEATNPVKLYEYLAAGKPVVAVDLPELEPFRGLYYSAATAEELVDRIEQALAEDSEALQRARFEMARENTWLTRYRSLEREIGALFGKAAIVIVSYNSLDYLKLCLTSVIERTVYPSFEIVVVDNASEPAVRQYLQEVAERDDRLKLVFNESNEGFPRATNIGIEAAGDCEYVVLLNNDTVVTRGWLSRLLRYLDDPRVTLVGPVTNWCGNEARIEVDYDSIDEMEEFARRYTSPRRGQAFELCVLAMYCVALRRELLDRIGLLDERFGIGMFEDDDFSRRVREIGGRLICAEDIFVHHWGRASFGRLSETAYQRVFAENRSKYEEKWGEPWQPHRYRSHAQRGSGSGR